MSKSKFPLESMKRDWKLPPNWVSYARIALAWLPAYLVVVGFHDSTLRWWAAALFLVLALSDGLDGLMARARNGRWVSEWGRFIDPVADKLLVTTVLGALCFAYLSQPLWWIVLSTTLFMTLREVVLFDQMRRRYDETQPPLWSGKVKTAFQMAMIVTWIAPMQEGWLSYPMAFATCAALIWTFVSWCDYYEKFVADVPRQ